MKTNYYLTTKNIPYLVLFFSGLLFVSCGSYQNSSYYDNDGVYRGTNGNREVTSNDGRQNNTNLAYQNYFKSKQLNAEETVFTDVESYSSVEDSSATSERNYDTYAAWGSNPTSVTVNVYDNNWGWNYWNSWYGPGWGWGWNNWYGSGWGWNVGWGWNSWYGPGWGWGWNNWYGPGWGYGWYGNGWYGHNYAYTRGRRTGGYYGNRYTDGRYNGRTSYTTSGRTSTRNNFGTGTRNSSTRGTQVSPRNSSNSRDYNYNNVGTRNSTRPNSNATSPSVRNNTPTRSSSAPTYSGSRSSSGSSFGGGRSSGGGGGRSGGGGRGRG